MVKFRFEGTGRAQEGFARREVVFLYGGRKDQITRFSTRQRFDIDHNGVINLQDFLRFAEVFGKYVTW